MSPRSGCRVRARGQAGPGAPLARANRHPVPARQARRPDRHANRACPAHHHRTSRACRRDTGVAGQCAWSAGRRRCCTCTPPSYCYAGDTDPSVPGGMTVIYRDLIASEARTRQVTTDVTAALALGRNCLVLTSWIAHLQKLADGLRAAGHDPVVLRGGMGAKDRAAALARLRPDLAGRRYSPSPPVPMPARASTVPRWTRSSSPHPSPTRASSSSTPDASSGPMTARPPPKSTTMSMNRPGCSPHLSPSAHPATSAWASRPAAAALHASAKAAATG